MHACLAGSVGARENRTGADPALSVPACVLCLPDARPLLCTLLCSGRSGHGLHAGPFLEDLLRLGADPACKQMDGLLLVGVVEIPDRGAAGHCAAPEPEKRRVTVTGTLMLAAFRGGLCVFPAL